MGVFGAVKHPTRRPNVFAWLGFSPFHVDSPDMIWSHFRQKKFPSQSRSERGTFLYVKRAKKTDFGAPAVWAQNFTCTSGPSLGLAALARPVPTGDPLLAARKWSTGREVVGQLIPKVNWSTIGPTEAGQLVGGRTCAGGRDQLAHHGVTNWPNIEVNWLG